MSKLERLLALTLTLLETPRPLTAAEIRERVSGYPDNDDSFHRAFERDKESLRSIGIPLQRTAISHTDPPADGYRIRAEDYYLRDPGFTADELAALHLAAASVPMPRARGLEAMWNLGGAPEVGEVTHIASLPDDENLGPLFRAVGEHRSVELVYHDERRRLDPYRLDFRRGRWYLTAFDHSRDDERVFRVDRIAGTVDLGAPGSTEREPGALRQGPAHPWEYGNNDPETIRVRFDAPQSEWVARHLGADAVETTHGDGSIDVAVEVTEWPAFRSFVLGFLDEAEVLGPPWAREEVVAWLRAVAAGGGHAA